MLYGPPGTGKTTSLELIQQLAYHPSELIINAHNISDASLREGLKKEETVVIDEADTIDEQILVRRFDRKSAKSILKVQDPMGRGWQTLEKNIFHMNMRYLLVL